jgi:hypothetical protein
VEVTAYKQDDAAAISESQGLGIAQTDACSAPWGVSKKRELEEANNRRRACVEGAGRGTSCCVGCVGCGVER